MLFRSGEAGGEYEATIPFTVPEDAPLGEHLMRAKTNWQGEVENACDEVQYGETEDYTVDLLPLGVTENLLGAADLVVATLENNHFQVSFETAATSETLTFQLFDTTGRILMQNRVAKAGDRYLFDFDMSYAPAGAYLIRLGNSQVGKVTRIAVR